MPVNRIISPRCSHWRLHLRYRRWQKGSDERAGHVSMGRLPLSLIVLLLCSGVAAAQTNLAPAAEPAETAAAESAETAAVELPERKPPKPPEPKSGKLPGARELFASVPGPAPLAARAIGFYSKGCLAGGIPLPLNGPDWQVMRTLSLIHISEPTRPS